MSKPCKFCGLEGHTKTFCYVRPKNPNLKRKAIRMIGKHGQKWLRTRAEWFKDNPAEFYVCYLCGDTLKPRETTLDHVIPRSRRPDLRYDFSNLRPCCFRCNSKKGSRTVDKLG